MAKGNSPSLIKGNDFSGHGATTIVFWLVTLTFGCRAVLYGGNQRLSGSIYFDKALGLGLLFFKLIWLVFGSVVVFRYCQSQLLLLVGIRFNQRYLFL